MLAPCLLQWHIRCQRLHERRINLTLHQSKGKIPRISDDPIRAPRVLKVAPSCAIMISSYEAGKSFFRRQRLLPGGA